MFGKSKKYLKDEAPIDQLMAGSTSLSLSLLLFVVELSSLVCGYSAAIMPDVSCLYRSTIFRDSDWSKTKRRKVQLPTWVIAKK